MITFYTIWAVIGAAMFGNTIDIAAIQSTPVDDHRPEKEPRA